MPTKIQWVRNPDGTQGETWNPVSGCSPVSEGCTHCYAKAMAQRLRGRFGYPQDDPFAVTLHPDRLEEPLRWKKPRMVFVNSMSDLFHPRVPDGFIGDVFTVMAATPEHTYQILTKRPERMLKVLTGDWLRPFMAAGQYPFLKRPSPGSVWALSEIWPLPNVWAGTSVESAKYLPRLDVLARIPAKVRFVSAEPLLSALNIKPYFYACSGCGVKPCTCKGLAIHQVIVGGESGPKARPMHPEWARSVRDACLAAGVPFFFKRGLLDGVAERGMPG